MENLVENSEHREDLEHFVCEQLRLEGYRFIEERIIASDKQVLFEAYFSVFPLLFKKYVKLAENSDEENAKLLVAALDKLLISVDLPSRYTSVMEVYGEATSLKSIIYVSTKLKEVLLSLNQSMWEHKLLDELRDDVLPYFLRKFRDFVADLDDLDEEDMICAAHLFIEIFRLSECRSFFLLDSLINFVLSYMPTHYEQIHPVLTNCVLLYYGKNAKLTPWPILIAASLGEEVNTVGVKWLLQFLVYSPVYNLERCAPVFFDTLIKTSNNPNVLLSVSVALQAVINPIKDGALSRECLPSHIDFIGQLLSGCVYPVLEQRVRSEGLRVCNHFISRFEPVGQILIIRRLITLIINNTYKDVLEPQAIAWLIDIYRKQLGKNLSFTAELGYLWADLAQISYESLHDAVNFYTAMMVLAQYQALQKINRSLMKSVKIQVLNPLADKIRDWSILVGQKNGVELDTLPYLQTMMLETQKFVDAFLRDELII